MWTEFVFEVVLITIVGIFGIIGNFIVQGFLVKLDQKIHFHHLMITLQIYDTIYISFSILVFAVPEMFEEFKIEGHYFYIAPVAFPMLQVALTGSTYCAVSISIERYLTVCHPFYVHARSWSVKRYIVPIIVFSLFFNAPHFFEFRTNYIGSQCLDYNQSYEAYPSENESSIDYGSVKFLTGTSSMKPNLSLFDDGYTSSEVQTDVVTRKCNSTRYKYKFESTPMSENESYYIVYRTALKFIFNLAIPSGIIISLSILLYRQIKMTPINSNQSHRSSIPLCKSHHHNMQDNQLLQTKTSRLNLNEVQLSKLSICIALIRTICQSIKWIPNIYELVQLMNSKDLLHIIWPLWVESIIDISHFLMVLNSSVHSYVYLMTHFELFCDICLWCTRHIPPV